LVRGRGAYIVQSSDLLLDDGVDAALDLLSLVRSLPVSIQYSHTHTDTEQARACTEERERERERERKRERERG
jgi:hypothetical protein